MKPEKSQYQPITEDEVDLACQKAVERALRPFTKGNVERSPKPKAETSANG